VSEQAPEVTPNLGSNSFASSIASSGTGSLSQGWRPTVPDVIQGHVLVVEDEGDIRELLTLHLQRGGFTIDTASTGDEALNKLRGSAYDLVVLDWMLPGCSGIEILRQMRTSLSQKETPVLMLTAKSTASDIVLGLESGADDYVTKPFEPVVLLARARSILRRRTLPTSESKTNVMPASTVAPALKAPVAAAEEIIRIGDLTINPVSYEVSFQDKPIQLTLSEFKLLHALGINRGRVLTRDQLIELVQGSGVIVVDRAIDTHVFGLRKKLGECANFIETVRGVGYRINWPG